MKDNKNEVIEILEDNKKEIDVPINQKSKNSRKIYFLLLIVMTLAFTTISFTYAMFTTSSIKNNAVSIKTGSLSLAIKSSELNENNEVLINADEEKQITLSISNPNETSVKYNLYYYSNNDLTNVEIGYTDAGDIAPTTTGDVLAKINDPGQEKKIRVYIKNNSQNSVTITFGVNVGLHNKPLTFPEQKSSIAKTNKVYSCKKATTESLHKETCSYNDQTSFCSGSGYTSTGSKQTTEITYGNISEIGELKSGDAFDCDVNNDGIYNSETERFYYVADIDTNTAALIYYNNVSAGDPNNSSAYAYDTNADVYTNGPITAASQLPTTAIWSNVSLTNPLRNITDENDTIKKNNFTYEQYAARLLTIKEVNQACGIEAGNSVVGELDNCNYLMENTKYSSNNNGTYGYWLENAKSDSTQNAWYLNGGTYRYVNYKNASGIEESLGVRPVIEIKKANILY